MDTERYFIQSINEVEKEVSKAEWIRYERQAGFRPKCASSHPHYWTRCVTNGFTGNGLTGRIVYSIEE